MEWEEWAEWEDFKRTVETSMSNQLIQLCTFSLSGNILVIVVLMLQMFEIMYNL